MIENDTLLTQPATMVDTHSHIYFPDFDADRDAMLQRAAAVGVTEVLIPNVDLDSLERMFQVEYKHVGVRMMLGLHPTCVKDDYQAVLAQLKQHLGPSHPFVAIGEIGIDYYWDTTYKAEQIVAFVEQMEWARAYHLPVSIHCRDAYDVLYEQMTSHNYHDMRGFFHCFAGTQEDAQRLMAFDGFMFGVGGTVTYKISHLPAILKSTIPLDRIVLETDAPYLSPVPHRGKRNEPANLVNVVAKLAAIYEVSDECVMKQTTANALRVY